MTEKNNYVVLVQRRDYKSKQGEEFTAISMIRISDFRLIERSLPKAKADEIPNDIFANENNIPVCEAILEDRGFSMALLGFAEVGTLKIKVE